MFTQFKPEQTQSRPSNTSVQGPDKKIRGFACLNCHKRKIRCDFIGDATQCTGCRHRGVKCEPSESKARTTKLKKSIRLLHIEERLNRIRSVCEMAGWLSEEDLEFTRVLNGRDSIGEDTSHAITNKDTPNIHRAPTPKSIGNDKNYAVEARRTRNVFWQSPHPINLLSWPKNSPESYFQRTTSEANPQKANIGTDCPDLGRTTGSSIAALQDTYQPFDEFRPSWSNSFDMVISGTHTIEHPNPLVHFQQSDAPLSSAEIPGLPIEMAESSNLNHHFDILTTIFTDTTETQILSELRNMTPLPASISLPHRDVTLSALTAFFRHFDKLMPLYDKSTTFHLVELFFEPMLYPKAELASYVYSVVALSFMCCKQWTTPSIVDSEFIAWTYFGYAARYIPELTATRPGLLSVQALLGMVVFLMMQGAIKTALPLIVAVVEMCKSMRFERGKSYSAERTTQLHEIASVLHNRICFYLGLPAPQNLELPTVDYTQVSEPANDRAQKQTVVGPFLTMTSLTSKIQNNSVVSLDQFTNAGSVSKVQDLNKALEEWRLSLNLPVSPVHVPESMSQLTNPAHIGLQICYYHILILINQPSILAGSRLTLNIDFSTKAYSLAHEVCTTFAFKVCLEAARRTIRLFCDLPSDLRPLFRGLTVYMIEAAVILSVNIMHVEPRSAAVPDFKLLCSAQAYLLKCAQRAAGSKTAVMAGLYGRSVELTLIAGRSLDSV